MTEPAEGATGPLAVLSAGAAALARASDLDGALAVIVEAGAAAAGAPMAAVLFSNDTDRARLELLVTLGMADEQGSRVRGRRWPTTRTTRSTGRRSTGRARWDGRGRRQDGELDDRSPTCRWSWPAAASRRAWACCRSAGTGEHEVDADEERLLVAVARSRGGRDRVVPDVVDGHRAGRVVRARRAHRPADRAGERADAQPRARARGRAGAAPGRRGLGRDVRRRRLHASSTRRPASRAGDQVLRQVARGARRRRVRLVDTVARTGGDEFVLVAPGSAGVTVARRVLDGIAGARGRRGAPGQRQRRASPGSRRTAPTRSRCSRRPARRSSTPPEAPRSSEAAREPSA